VKLNRVPEKANLAYKTSKDNKYRMRYYCKYSYRNTFLKRCNISPYDPRNDIRTCNRHILKTEKLDVEWLDNNNRI
jgi:hypothetical protein